MANATSAVSEPYVGPAPFGIGDEYRFFGRDDERDDLVALIFAHRVLFLYAQSGAGKTSLINASLIPELGRRQMRVLHVPRVGLDHPATSPSCGRFSANALAQLPGDRPVRSVADRLAALKAGQTEAPRATVLIFDQFEELFTRHPECQPERVAFFSDLDTAMADDPNLRLVLALREEYLADLDPYEATLRERPAMRYRLQRLGRDAAIEAVEEPMKLTERSYADGVAAQIVDRLRMVRAAGGREVEGEWVEPVYLQVICRSVWKSLQPGERVVRESHVRAFGGVDQALAAFYDEGVAAAAEGDIETEHSIRRWFERELITPERTRASVYRGRASTGTLSNGIVDKLEAARLVRHEPRAGHLWCELTHDRLIESVFTSNDAWRARAGESARTWQWLESLGSRFASGDIGPLEEPDFTRAVEFVKSPEGRSVLTMPGVRTLLDTSKRARLEQRRRTRLLVAFVAVLGVAALFAAWMAWRAEDLNRANVALKDEVQKKYEEARKLNADLITEFDGKVTALNDAEDKRRKLEDTTKKLQARETKLNDVNQELIKANDKLDEGNKKLIQAGKDREEQQKRELQAAAEVARLNERNNQIEEQRRSAAAHAELVSRERVVVDLARRALDQARNNPDVALLLAAYAFRDLPGNGDRAASEAGWRYMRDRATDDTLVQSARAAAASSLRVEDIPAGRYSPIALAVSAPGMMRLVNRDGGMHTVSGADAISFQYSRYHVRTVNPIRMLGLLRKDPDPSDSVAVHSAAIAPGGEAFAFGMSRGEVITFGDKFRDESFRIAASPIAEVAFDPQARFLSAVSTSGRWALRDRENRKTRESEKNKEYRVLGICLGKDAAYMGQILARSDDNVQVGILDPHSGKVLGSLHEDRFVPVKVQCHPAAALVAVGGRNGRVVISNLKGVVTQNLLGDDTGELTELAFSANGTMLAAGTSAGDVRVWVHEGDSYRPLVSIPAHRARIRAVAFDPRGVEMATLDVAGVLRRWTLQPLLGPGSGSPVLRTVQAEEGYDSSSWGAAMRQIREAWKGDVAKGLASLSKRSDLTPDECAFFRVLKPCPGLKSAN